MLRIFYFLLLIVSIAAQAQKTDNKLQGQIEILLKGFHGEVGVYVHDLKHNRIVAINADTVFPHGKYCKNPYTHRYYE